MSSILLMRKLRLMVVVYNTLKIAQFVGGETLIGTPVCFNLNTKLWLLATRTNDKDDTEYVTQDTF